MCVFLQIRGQASKGKLAPLMLVKERRLMNRREVRAWALSRVGIFPPRGKFNIACHIMARKDNVLIFAENSAFWENEDGDLECDPEDIRRCER